MVKLYLTFLILLLGSCVERDLDDLNVASSNGMAYVPVYASGETGKVTAQSARPTVKAGKIYAYGDFIFQNELNEGIHIIDNSDTRQPRKVGFLSIPYNTEMAVKGSYVYANSLRDLLVIDMQNPLNPSVVKVVKGAFPVINQLYPPQQGMFVCPDSTRGIVIEWELKQVEKANCRR